MLRILLAEIKYNILLTIFMAVMIIGIDSMFYFHTNLIDFRGFYDIRFILAFNGLYPYNHRFEKQNRTSLFKILPLNYSNLGIVRILWTSVNIALLIILDLAFHTVFFKHIEWTSMLGKGETLQIIMIFIGYFMIYYDVRKIFQLKRKLALTLGAIAIGAPLVIFVTAGLLNLSDNFYNFLLLITSLLIFSFTAVSFKYRIRF